MGSIQLQGLGQSSFYASGEISPELFGANFLFDRDGAQGGGAISNTYAEFAAEVNLGSIRYPGGGMTEIHFDLANPNSPNQDYSGLAGERREPTVGISDFLQFAGETGAKATIVIPTYRFLTDTPDGSGHRKIDTSEEANLRSFLSLSLREAAEAGTEISAFEVGNEWYIENTHVFGFTMSPVEYGRVAAYLAVVIQEEIDKHNAAHPGSSTDPDIVVQVGPGGNAEFYTESGHPIPEGYEGAVTQATELILRQFRDVESREAVDGILAHRYITNSDAFVTGWAYDPFETWTELTSDIPGFADVERYVTEWNVAARNSNEWGLKQFDSMIELADEMIRAGVDYAHVWAVQQRNETRLIENTGLGNESYGGLSIGGVAFDMMATQLPGLKAMDLPNNTDGLIQHAFGSSDRFVYFLTNRSEEGRTDSISVSAAGTNAHHMTIYEVTVDEDGKPLVQITTVNLPPGTTTTNIDFIANETIMVVLARGNSGVVIEGYTLADNLTGSMFSDTVLGGEGQDSLFGMAGNDVLNGEIGSDLLFGGAGSDMLVDGTGRDTLSGGTGSDLFLLSADGEVDLINDFQVGVDRIDLSAWGWSYTSEALLITSTATGALITYGDEVLVLSTSEGLPINLQDLHITNFIGLEPVLNGGTIRGTQGSDRLIGTNENDSFVGSAGADIIDGRDGFDILDFSDSASAQSVALGALQVVGGITTGPVYVSIEGIVGSRFNDTLSGNNGDNVFNGGGGNDRLSTGAGNDIVRGGLGSDFLYGGSGADVLYGGEGKDRAGYSSAIVGVLADLAHSSTNQGDASGDRYFGLEGLEGSNHADTLRGDAQGNELFGINGDDLLEGRAGNDTIYGGNGNDTLIGGAGADFLDGGNGINIVTYADSTAALRIDLSDPALSTGHAHGDRFRGIFGIEGSAFSDSFFGGTANDRFWGRAGNDRIDGQAGSDWLEGGVGNDLIYGGEGNDTLFGGAGADRIDGGAGSDIASYADALAGVVLNLTLPTGNLGDARGDTLVGVEGVQGSRFADTLVGDGFANTFWGAVGNDRLEGRTGNDRLFGGDGNDTLFGGAGNDLLDGGAGSDWASWSDMTAGVVADLADWTRSTGGAGQDRVTGIENLIGTAFADRLLGDAGGNRLLGGKGNDRLEGRAGADTLAGEDGNDTLLGGAGADRLDGGAGNDVLGAGTGPGWLDANWLDGGLGDDRLAGGAGADSLLGGAGNDQLRAGDGADRLFGGAGNDLLDGGKGDDLMTGGAGSDTFVFVGGHDTILDFTEGQDHIRLEADLWGGTPPAVSALLADATLTDTGLILTLGDGASLDIRGIFDSTLLEDAFLFV